MSKPNRETTKAAKLKFRLGCIHCDRNDFDGIEQIPTDWQTVFPVQLWETSVKPFELSRQTSSIFAWETHLGVCPACSDQFERSDAPDNALPPWDVTADEEANERDRKASLSIHPIIRQVIDRDCHVGESNRTVVRHVISKLKNGYESFRSMPSVDRRCFIDQCIFQHRRNRKEYVEVMSGFTRTTGESHAGKELPSCLSGKEIVGLMRKHKVTIAKLSFRLGTSMKRVRQIREQGLSQALAVRDWIQAITGIGPRPDSGKVSDRKAARRGELLLLWLPALH